MVLLVQPSPGSDNTTYVVDVGSGSSCLMRPLLLSADPSNFVLGLTKTERHRLVFEPPPDTSLASSSDLANRAGGQWHIEVGHQKSISSSIAEASEPEISWYCQVAFKESSEFGEEDIIYASFAVAHRAYPTGFFWNNITCVRIFTVDDDLGNQQLERSKRPMYRIILHGNEVKKSYGAQSEVIKTLGSEMDRIRALRDIFGIKLQDKDEIHIKGRAAALKLD
ncbi:hypothetical protein D9756_007012 [Leucocoprinus leucothites]|uniref:Arylamine N-acetyltransferase n=1 Tax=Leucocoprinus leucothites TaxID=201217 RepID=A0A8H5FYT2_9AGAR|nr:hypothetical protein D9756_007012 [Leucoagaricus leucothites]